MTVEKELCPHLRTFSAHKSESVLLRVDNVSVFASLSGSFVFGVQLGILGVLGACWIRVVATAQQVQTTSSITESLEQSTDLNIPFRLRASPRTCKLHVGYHLLLF